MANAARQPDRLRERFRHAVRDSLLEAAEQSIVEDGVEGANLQSIARRAGVAVGTIYNHFQDGQELFRELFTMRRVEVFAAIDAAMKSSAKATFEAQLEAFARALLAYYDTRRDFMRVVFGSDTLRLQMMCDKSGRHRPFLHELQSRAERIMRAGVRERKLGEDDVELFASVFTSILRGVVASRLDQRASLADSAPRVVDILQGSESMTSQVAGEQSVPAAEAPAAPKRGVKPYVILGIIVALGLSAYIVFRAVTAGKEDTDDAQVAADMVPLAARVSGTVVQLPVTDNQAVKKDQLIAEIDPTDYRTRQKQAEAELAAAKAQADAADAQVMIVESSSKGGLSSARAALSGTAASALGADAQIAAAQAALDRSRADASKAESDLQRAEQLRKDDAIPQAQLDTARTSAASAHAAVAQAQAQLAASQEAKATAQTRVAEAQGRVEQSTPVDAQREVARANAALAHARFDSAQAALELAKTQLANTRIVAPFDGHVARLGVHMGQLVSVSQVVTNVLPDTTYVIANFKETQVGDMRAGQPATVSIDALPGRTFHAKVESISYGTGAEFSLLPPDNASGNFVKVVQRVPVKLTWVEVPDDVHLQAGLSVDVTVSTRP